MTPLNHAVHWSGRNATLTLPTEIDATNAGTLIQVLRDLIRQRPQLLTIDLTKTSYCDSAGIRALVISHRDAEASGCQLQLAVSNSPVSRILTLTGLDQVIPLC